MKKLMPTLATLTCTFLATTAMATTFDLYVKENTGTELLITGLNGVSKVEAGENQSDLSSQHGYLIISPNEVDNSKIAGFITVSQGTVPNHVDGLAGENYTKINCDLRRADLNNKLVTKLLDSDDTTIQRYTCDTGSFNSNTYYGEVDKVKITYKNNE